jgi:formylglycine-generating enzyme required for sulfatase activity
MARILVIIWLATQIICMLASCKDTPTETAHLPFQSVEFADGAVLEFIEVPAGRVWLGSPEDEFGHSIQNEGTYRLAEVGEFRIAKTEVSNQLYQLFIDAGDYNNENYWTAESWEWLAKQDRGKPVAWDSKRKEFGEQFAAMPVNKISYYEAEAFVSWCREQTGVPVHLPTLAQWEYAAEGETAMNESRLFPWGDRGKQDVPDEADWQYVNTGFDAKGDSFDGPAPCGTMRGDVSWCGVLDMGGNVSEYTCTLETEMPGTSHLSEENAEFRVCKGGSWMYKSPADATLETTMSMYKCSTSIPVGVWRNTGGIRLVIDER